MPYKSAPGLTPLSKRIAPSALALFLFATPALAFDGYPAMYSPSSGLTAHGSVQVGSFVYLPAVNGKVKPNQIHNRALMVNKYIDESVDGFVRDATFNELRFVGIDVRGTDRILTGEIQQYSIDDISNPFEWTVVIRYVVKDKAGNTLYDAVKSSNPTSIRWSEWNFKELKPDIEALIADPDFIKAIN